jgi:hypothetical protein
MAYEGLNKLLKTVLISRIPIKPTPYLQNLQQAYEESSYGMVILKDFPLSYKATAELGFKPMMHWLVIEDCTYKLQLIA